MTLIHFLVCNICGKQLQNEKDFQNHLKIFHREKYLLGKQEKEEGKKKVQEIIEKSRIPDNVRAWNEFYGGKEYGKIQ